MFARLLPRSGGPRKIENLFTEVVAWLFERRPDLCIDWLRENRSDALEHAAGGEEPRVGVRTQKWIGELEHHRSASLLDLLIEARWTASESSDSEISNAVLVESKIGSREGERQLRRLAEHLEQMEGYAKKTLLYITRGYDPKEEARAF